MDENTFLTKTGECQVTESEIIISRETVAGRLSTALFGPTVAKAFGMYLVVGLVLLVNGVFFLYDGQVHLGLVLLLSAFLLVGSIIKNRILSSTSRISLSEISKIEPYPPLTGFRGFFVIHFTRNNKKLQRIIILPGAARDGKAEYKKAKRIIDGISL
ncbi:hypothetical protein [Desulfatibacillum aliphaticivorans]|uniref:hypothetical protein n=1 Tax=Desulfatibacillum aliphaticivorans TaxID=218208 RepID=UPI000422588A|nr:hypothetical protein [Desulfatibacillum aliphaticivorans]